METLFFIITLLANWCVRVQEYGVEVLGLDISCNMVGLALEKLHDLNIQNVLHWVPLLLLLVLLTEHSPTAKLYTVSK